DRRHRDVVAVGVAGLLTREHAHANPLRHVLARLLDETVLERDAGRRAELEIEVAIVRATRQCGPERALERAGRHAVAVRKKPIGFCRVRHGGWQEPKSTLPDTRPAASTPRTL